MIVLWINRRNSSQIHRVSTIWNVLRIERLVIEVISSIIIKEWFTNLERRIDNMFIKGFTWLIWVLNCLFYLIDFISHFSKSLFQFFHFIPIFLKLKHQFMIFPLQDLNNLLRIFYSLLCSFFSIFSIFEFSFKSLNLNGFLWSLTFKLLQLSL